MSRYLLEYPGCASVHNVHNVPDSPKLLTVFPAVSMDRTVVDRKWRNSKFYHWYQVSSCTGRYQDNQQPRPFVPTWYEFFVHMQKRIQLNAENTVPRKEWDTLGGRNPQGTSWANIIVSVAVLHAKAHDWGQEIEHKIHQFDLSCKSELVGRRTYLIS